MAGIFCPHGCWESTQQSQLPEQGSEQGTLILPAWVSGKDQMGVEGMRGRMSEAARGLKSKAE